MIITKRRLQYASKADLLGVQGERIQRQEENRSRYEVLKAQEKKKKDGLGSLGAYCDMRYEIQIQIAMQKGRRWM
jgi:hypothetical protein